MSQYAPEKPKNIVPFAPGAKDQRDDSDVDRSGHAIVALLQEAAQVASANCERAMDVAHKLSGQLRAAEDRARCSRSSQKPAPATMASNTDAATVGQNRRLVERTEQRALRAGRGRDWHLRR